MTILHDDIAAFDRMRDELETAHGGEWVVFHKGVFEGAFAAFEEAAESAVERFDAGPYLIRQVGVVTMPLRDGAVFKPARILDGDGGELMRLARRGEKRKGFGAGHSNLLRGAKLRIIVDRH